MTDECLAEGIIYFSFSTDFRNAQIAICSRLGITGQGLRVDGVGGVSELK